MPLLLVNISTKLKNWHKDNPPHWKLRYKRRKPIEWPIFRLHLWLQCTWAWRTSIICYIRIWGAERPTGLSSESCALREFAFFFHYLLQGCRTMNHCIRFRPSPFEFSFSKEFLFSMKGEFGGEINWEGIYSCKVQYQVF